MLYNKLNNRSFIKNIFCLFFVFLFSCSSQQTISINELKNGDFVFVQAKVENLSGAINRVTQKSETENFDHVGLIEIQKGEIFVLHSAPKLGSTRQNFEDFFNEKTQNEQKMVIYRLKKEYQKAIEPAITKAKTLLNKPYNWSYILNENSYYCSDFIERAFRKDSIFEHIEMNFKNSKTDKIDDFWIDFYKKLNIDVPQNMPGTNPNQLARSEKLFRLGILL